MTNMMRRFLFVAALAAPALVDAQENVTLPPIRVGPAIQRISTAAALSTEPLGSVTSVLELSDGRVLVNDGVRRRLLLMDTTLTTVEVILDSLSHIANTYGTRPGALIPFRGDTTLFVDPASYALIVIDPAGKVARVRSVWRVQDVPWITSATGTFGWPGVDQRGRIVYRTPAQPARPLVAPPAGVPYIPQQPDSAFVVAVDLDTRRLDTLGAIKIPKTEISLRRTPEGYFTFNQIMNPLPATDEWALLPDGRVAFMRWREYRIDYLNPDRSWTSSAKLPFDWQRLTDEDKVRLIDSVKVVQQRQAQIAYVTSMIHWVNRYGRGFPDNFSVPDGYTLPPGLPRDWLLPEGVNFPENYVYACPPGVEPPAPAAPTIPAANTPGAARPAPSCMPAPVMVSGGVTPRPPTVRAVELVPPDELPDYRPPIPPGAMRADLDGNLWIRINPPRPIPGGPVFDIVDSAGELVNRLQVPPGYTLVGFGRDKVVYLSMRDASGIHLARVRLR